MTLIIVIAALAVLAAAMTIHHLTTDGYHRLPTSPEATHYYR